MLMAINRSYPVTSQVESSVVTGRVEFSRDRDHYNWNWLWFTLFLTISSM